MPLTLQNLLVQSTGQGDHLGNLIAMASIKLKPLKNQICQSLHPRIQRGRNSHLPIARLLHWLYPQDKKWYPSWESWFKGKGADCKTNVIVESNLEQMATLAGLWQQGGGQYWPCICGWSAIVFFWSSARYWGYGMGGDSRATALLKLSMHWWTVTDDTTHYELVIISAVP